MSSSIIRPLENYELTTESKAHRDQRLKRGTTAKKIGERKCKQKPKCSVSEQTPEVSEKETFYWTRHDLIRDSISAATLIGRR